MSFPASDEEVAAYWAEYDRRIFRRGLLRAAKIAEMLVVEFTSEEGRAHTMRHAIIEAIRSEAGEEKP